jgi:hypothetical protein
MSLYELEMLRDFDDEWSHAAIAAWMHAEASA